MHLPLLSPELLRRRDLLMAKLSSQGTSPGTIHAMTQVRRDLLVPDDMRVYSYDDTSLRLSAGQTISQPFVVAHMARGLELIPTDRVLEVGCGSGYAAAVLSLLADEVYTIERIEELAQQAQQTLTRLKLGSGHVRSGDGTLGWPEEAPFNAILVSASGPHVPESLLNQLAVGGRLVMPVEDDSGGQELVRVRRTSETETERSALGAVRFVPLVGQEGW